jgi:hypothetical protein
LGINGGRTGDGKRGDTDNGKLPHANLLSRLPEHGHGETRNQLTVWTECRALPRCN